MAAILIKYFVEDLPELTYIDGKSDWIDLYVAKDVELKAGEFKLIPLGVAMQLPGGYEAIVAPRSSTFKKYGILQANSLGIIDNTYCGPTDQWMFPAYATRDIKVNKGDRLCQFRILENQPKIDFVKSTLEHNIDRDGFGSTGN